MKLMRPSVVARFRLLPYARDGEGADDLRCGGDLDADLVAAAQLQDADAFRSGGIDR